MILFHGLVVPLRDYLGFSSEEGVGGNSGLLPSTEVSNFRAPYFGTILNTKF